eukprot:4139517-Pleurochrysis_carterae.AAC.1
MRTRLEQLERNIEGQVSARVHAAVTQHTEPLIERLVKAELALASASVNAAPQAAWNAKRHEEL